MGPKILQVQSYWCHLQLLLKELERTCFKKSNRKVKTLRQVRFVNNETDRESDYEETSSDSDKYLYNIKTWNQRIKQNTKGSSTAQQQTNWFTDRHGGINQHNWPKTYKRIGSTKVKKDKEPKLISCGGGDPLKRYGTLIMHVETKTKHDICKLHLIEGTYGSLPNSNLIRSGIGTIKQQTQDSH